MPSKTLFPAAEGRMSCDERWSLTRRPWFALVPVHEQPVPWSAEHTAQLGDGEGVDVLADCGDTRAEGQVTRLCEFLMSTWRALNALRVGPFEWFTQRGLPVSQMLQHGVEGPDEEVVPELHHWQPQQVPEEEPGEEALAESLLCRDGSRGKKEGEDKDIKNDKCMLSHTPGFTGDAWLRGIPSTSLLVVSSSLVGSALLESPQVSLTRIRGHKLIPFGLKPNVSLYPLLKS